MFEVMFSMALIFANGVELPPYKEPVATIEECVKKVDEMSREMAEIKDQSFTFAAGCVIRMKRAEPT